MNSHCPPGPHHSLACHLTRSMRYTVSLGSRCVAYCSAGPQSRDSRECSAQCPGPRRPALQSQRGGWMQNLPDTRSRSGQPSCRAYSLCAQLLKNTPTNASLIHWSHPKTAAPPRVALTYERLKNSQKHVPLIQHNVSGNRVSCRVSAGQPFSRILTFKLYNGACRFAVCHGALHSQMTIRHAQQIK